MRLGIYSRLARQDLVDARRFIAEGRPRASPSGFWPLPKQAVASQNLNDVPACPRNRCPLRYWNTHSSTRLVRFNFSAISTSRRIASEREGLSGCCLAQSSICDLSAGDSRTAVTGSWPVGGRPRLFFRNTGIDFGINLYYVKTSRWEGTSSPPALTQAAEVSHGPGWVYYYSNPRADVSWTAAEVHKSRAPGAHRTQFVDRDR